MEFAAFVIAPSLLEGDPTNESIEEALDGIETFGPWKLFGEPVSEKETWLMQRYRVLDEYGDITRTSSLKMPSREGFILPALKKQYGAWLTYDDTACYQGWKQLALFHTNRNLFSSVTRRRGVEAMSLQSTLKHRTKIVPLLDEIAFTRWGSIEPKVQHICRFKIATEKQAQFRISDPDLDHAVLKLKEGTEFQFGTIDPEYQGRRGQIGKKVAATTEWQQKGGWGSFLKLFSQIDQMGMNEAWYRTWVQNHALQFISNMKTKQLKTFLFSFDLQTAGEERKRIHEIAWVCGMCHVNYRLHPKWEWVGHTLINAIDVCLRVVEIFEGNNLAIHNYSNVLNLFPKAGVVPTCEQRARLGRYINFFPQKGLNDHIFSNDEVAHFSTMVNRIRIGEGGVAAIHINDEYLKKYAVFATATPIRELLVVAVIFSLSFSRSWAEVPVPIVDISGTSVMPNYSLPPDEQRPSDDIEKFGNKLELTAGVDAGENISGLITLRELTEPPQIQLFPDSLNITCDAKDSQVEDDQVSVRIDGSITFLTDAHVKKRESWMKEIWRKVPDQLSNCTREALLFSALMMRSLRITVSNAELVQIYDNRDKPKDDDDLIFALGLLRPEFKPKTVFERYVAEHRDIGSYFDLLIPDVLSNWWENTTTEKSEKSMQIWRQRAIEMYMLDRIAYSFENKEPEQSFVDPTKPWREVRNCSEKLRMLKPADILNAESGYTFNPKVGRLGFIDDKGVPWLFVLSVDYYHNNLFTIAQICAKMKIEYSFWTDPDEEEDNRIDIREQQVVMRAQGNYDIALTYKNTEYEVGACNAFPNNTNLNVPINPSHAMWVSDIRSCIALLLCKDDGLGSTTRYLMLISGTKLLPDHQKKHVFGPQPLPLSSELGNVARTSILTLHTHSYVPEGSKDALFHLVHELQLSQTPRLLERLSGVFAVSPDGERLLPSCYASPLRFLSNKAQSKKRGMGGVFQPFDARSHREEKGLQRLHSLNIRLKKILGSIYQKTNKWWGAYPRSVVENSVGSNVQKYLSQELWLASISPRIHVNSDPTYFKAWLSRDKRIIGTIGEQSIQDLKVLWRLALHNSLHKLSLRDLTRNEAMRVSQKFTDLLGRPRLWEEAAFEAATGIFLRNDQLDLLKDWRGYWLGVEGEKADDGGEAKQEEEEEEEEEEKGKSYVVRSIMGSGKTKVLLPNLILSAWTMKRNVMIIQPAHLVPQTYESLLGSVLSILSHRQVKFYYGADTRPSAGPQGNKLYRKWPREKEEEVKEEVGEEEKKEAEDSGEASEVLSQKSGARGDAGKAQSPETWIWLLSDTQAKSVYLEARINEDKWLFADTAVLMDEVDSMFNCFRSAYNVPFGKQISHPCPDIALHNVNLMAFYQYVLAVGFEVDGLDVIEETLPEVVRKSVNRVRSMAEHMIHEVHYGLASDERRLLAVPYRFAGAPENSSNFADLGVTALLTIRVKREKGWALRDVEPLQEWLRTIGKLATGILLEYYGIKSLSYSLLMFQPIHFVLSNLRKYDVRNELLKKYCVQKLLPENLFMTDKRSNVSFVDMMTTSFAQQRLGFSGTKLIKLPTTDEFQWTKDKMGDLDGDAYIHATIVTGELKWAQHDPKLELVLHEVSENNCSVIIDVAAVLKDHDPLAVLSEWNLTLGNPENAIFVYIDSQTHIPKQLNGNVYTGDWRRDEKVYVYFDQQHTVGIDLKLPSKAKAMTLLDCKSRITDAAQGIFRMRQILHGQKSSFLFCDRDNVSIENTQELLKMLQSNDGQYLVSMTEKEDSPYVKQFSRAKKRITNKFSKESFIIETKGCDLEETFSETKRNCSIMIFEQEKEQQQEQEQRKQQEQKSELETNLIALSRARRESCFEREAGYLSTFKTWEPTILSPACRIWENMLILLSPGAAQFFETSSMSHACPLSVLVYSGKHEQHYRIITLAEQLLIEGAGSGHELYSSYSKEKFSKLPKTTYQIVHVLLGLKGTAIEELELIISLRNHDDDFRQALDCINFSRPRFPSLHTRYIRKWMHADVSAEYWVWNWYRNGGIFDDPEDYFPFVEGVLGWPLDGVEATELYNRIRNQIEKGLPDTKPEQNPLAQKANFSPSKTVKLAVTGALLLGGAAYWLSLPPKESDNGGRGSSPSQKEINQFLERSFSTDSRVPTPWPRPGRTLVFQTQNMDSVLYDPHSDSREEMVVSVLRTEPGVLSETISTVNNLAQWTRLGHKQIPLGYIGIDLITHMTKEEGSQADNLKSYFNISEKPLAMQDIFATFLEKRDIGAALSEKNSSDNLQKLDSAVSLLNKVSRVGSLARPVISSIFSAEQIQGDIGFSTSGSGLVQFRFQYRDRRFVAIPRDLLALEVWNFRVYERGKMEHPWTFSFPLQSSEADSDLCHIRRTTRDWSKLRLGGVTLTPWTAGEGIISDVLSLYLPFIQSQNNRSTAMWIALASRFGYEIMSRLGKESYDIDINPDSGFPPQVIATLLQSVASFMTVHIGNFAPRAS